MESTQTPPLDLWFREVHKEDMALQLRVKELLWSGESEFQRLDVIDTHALGRVLLLDGLFMTTERDEFIYHEMLVHTPMFTHPDPKRVLIIGGGDGGTAREVIRHPSVEHVDLVEIDKLVVEKSIEFLPTISCALSDPRVHVHYADGIAWVKEHPESYDVILIDSTDPIGPAVGLFSEPFYGDCRRAMRGDGVLAAQTESPFFDQEELGRIVPNLRAVFPKVRFYTASIPTYPGGFWSFALASPNRDPLLAPSPTRLAKFGDELKVYNAEIHQAAFALPNYFKQFLDKPGG